MSAWVGDVEIVQVGREPGLVWKNESEELVSFNLQILPPILGLKKLKHTHHSHLMSST